ncbi:hypothetical protein SMC26_29925 [Actinomadura fulvescens]|uniref:Integral membrane protein n=1 Tax=Actinomadura fulvescens TaxID=46160 RepID=A0ABP6BLW7_9ACTN
MRRPGAHYGCSPMRRLWRRLGLERNELRRRIDRVQRLAALGLLALFLLAAPPVAGWCASWSYDSGLRAERAEHAERRQVLATVVSTGGVGSTGDRYVHETVHARWTAPDGTARTGSLPSWKGAKPGVTKRIWVDHKGTVAIRPRPHSRTVTDAAYAALAATTAVGIPILAAYGLLRRRFDRVRAAEWEAAWARMDTDAGHNRPS